MNFKPGDTIKVIDKSRVGNKEVNSTKGFVYIEDIDSDYTDPDRLEERVIMIYPDYEYIFPMVLFRHEIAHSRVLMVERGSIWNS